MTDDRKSGVLLIAGSIGGLLTMAIHPTSGVSPTAAQVEELVVVSGIAHSLAMVSFLAMFMGAIGVTRRLAIFEGAERPDRLAIAGLTIYGFAAVALLLATAVSGFIVPVLLRHMIHDAVANLQPWHIVLDAVFQFNQAFAKIYSVAASAAILLWSASLLRNGGLGRGIATYGCIVGPLLILLIAVGHLRLDVHGMAVVVLAHAVWFMTAGIQLWRLPDEHSGSAR